MSEKHLTPAMIERTLEVIDGSGIVDLMVPPRKPGTAGRTGQIRQNTRLAMIGFHLCTRLGQETTVTNAHQVLTQALPRDVQWQLGVLRPLTTKADAKRKAYDPDEPTIYRAGKPRKRIWGADGVEEVGYDDLYNAVTTLRKRLDYGHGSAPLLTEDEREARRSTVQTIVNRLIEHTTIPRLGDVWAIDATGQWVWSRGPVSPKRRLEKALRQASPGTEHDLDALEVSAIAEDEQGNTAPPEGEQLAPPPAAAKGRCLDAQWGYKTSKDGGRETGYGFHMHTVCRVPDPGADPDSEPLLVDGFELTPANADAVEASLSVIDRIRARHHFKRLIGDALYTNLKAERWSVPLAHRGIEQSLDMRADGHGVVDINGAQMQHRWMHCPAAPMDQRPLPPERASDDEWDEFHDRVEEFRLNWAFDRKESGLLGKSQSTKWICPARAGRVGCPVLGAAQVESARNKQFPIVTPPEDYETRPCCANKIMDFTPHPASRTTSASWRSGSTTAAGSGGSCVSAGRWSRGSSAS